MSRQSPEGKRAWRIRNRLRKNLPVSKEDMKFLRSHEAAVRKRRGRGPSPLVPVAAAPEPLPATEEGSASTPADAPQSPPEGVTIPTPEDPSPSSSDGVPPPVPEVAPAEAAAPADPPPLVERSVIVKGLADYAVGFFREANAHVRAHGLLSIPDPLMPIFEAAWEPTIERLLPAAAANARPEYVCAGGSAFLLVQSWRADQKQQQRKRPADMVDQVGRAPSVERVKSPNTTPLEGSGELAPEPVPPEAPPSDAERDNANMRAADGEAVAA